MWTPTCGTGGFQRMFLSGAGVKPVVPEGLFFRSRITPLGSSRSLTTRFFSCHPTCGAEKHTHKRCFIFVCRTQEYQEGGGGHSLRGSYNCLEVDLDDLVSSMDLPGQVCRGLEGKKRPGYAPSSDGRTNNRCRLHVSMSVKLFFLALRKCQMGLARPYCR